jgi:hypothetical protein
MAHTTLRGFKKHQADIGVTMVPFNMMVYLKTKISTIRTMKAQGLAC